MLPEMSPSHRYISGVHRKGPAGSGLAEGTVPLVGIPPLEIFLQRKITWNYLKIFSRYFELKCVSLPSVDMRMKAQLVKTWKNVGFKLYNFV